MGDKKLIQRLVDVVRNWGFAKCEEKAIEIECAINPYRTLPVFNMGGGVNSKFTHAKCIDAVEDGKQTPFDFNTSEFPKHVASIVICEQCIEHLHNTTWFLSQLYGMLKPGGTLLLSTENLISFPNLFAMLLGRAPFSTQAVCGRFVGGWKDSTAGPDIHVPMNHPAFSGIKGHVRVMTKRQLVELVEATGFKIEGVYSYSFNHYVLVHATK